MRARQRSGYRLIWFHHLEKTAGSTVVRLARLNGETFFGEHRNGLPVTDGGFVPLWDYSRNQLRKFIDDCERTQTTFVSSSFCPPDFMTLAADERVRLVTTLRHPVSRFVSAFKYEYLRVGRHREISTFRASAAPTVFSFQKLDNYYCRVLSRHWRDDVLSIEAVDAASVNLRLFDIAATIETKLWTERLCHHLGWLHHALKVNSSSASSRKVLSLLRHGNLRQLDRLLLRRAREPEPDLLESFKNDNRPDLELYNAAREAFESCRTGSPAVAGGSNFSSSPCLSTTDSERNH